MADPISQRPADSSLAEFAPTAGADDDGSSAAPRAHSRRVGDVFNAFPSVCYECDLTFEIKRVSPNSWNLLQLDPALLIGTRAFREDRVFRGDAEYLAERLRDLEALGSISCVHRMINDAGLPFWVTHCVRRVQPRKQQRLRGWIIPLGDDRRIKDVDQHVVSRFIHKLGNHLQLLTLLGNSLKNQLHESKDFESLQHTVEKSIELTRAFSDYSQEPGWLSEVDVEEVLNGVIGAKETAFIDKGITLDIAIGESVRGTTIRGDAYSLDAAIGGVLQNALEATESGGRVTLTAALRDADGKHRSVVQIRVSDNGCGIAPADLDKVAEPFFTTKKNHDGLGLSMATRFIEMHGGTLTVHRQPGEGVEVAIILPAALAKESINP
ncbi:MAG TPA: HAMP domain-containing sensor histidine kinase [Verrucomicrobiae bacterium]|nr:HAMP domain-containing sensor histidine kinase [Verrucomicrobiae bacterium]